MISRRQMLSAAAVVLPGMAHGALSRPAPLPPGYEYVARRMNVPPIVLYAVALQESKMRFGAQALPFPWTLCVAGQARRFANYTQAVSALRKSVAQGVTNVDCGCMQVNWRWHHQRLGSFWAALDPYPNLEAGASLLREHFEASHDWFVAVGRYHHPSDAARARRYAASVFARIPSISVRVRPVRAAGLLQACDLDWKGEYV